MMEFIAEVFQPANALATVCLLLMIVYWLLVILGAVGVDVLQMDIDVDPGDHSIHGGPVFAALQFFNLGDVPVTIVGSVFVLMYWAVTVLTNHYVNPNWEILIALYCFVPCVIVSLLLTKIVIAPLVPFFRRLNREGEVELNLIGRIGKVTSSEVTDQFGQVAIEQDGPPIAIHARCHGAKIPKGEDVEIVKFYPETNTYLVQLAKKLR